ncbi:hypothetical protein L596_022123 [Steinernema carpocapsae]|uniref:Peptidase M14 domain-containing protein n=1 Tax=Steinernema carpocapsae TaxID=34508 RepID=A0A4U5MKW0_STECR|nr:hypothetical protein L596_022123 [Steinernema carpocapsae]
MNALLSLGLVALLAILGSALPIADNRGYEYFDGHSVITIKTSTEDHVKALLEMEEKEGMTGIDFWKAPRKQKGSVDVRVAPEHAIKMEAFLIKHGLEYIVKIENLGKLIRKEQEQLSKRTIFKDGDHPELLTTNEFHNLQEIYAYLNSVSKTYNTVSLFNAGKSYQKNDLLGVKIGNPGDNKKSVLIHGCIHAREWLGCATMLYVINELTANAAQYKDLLDKVDVYVLPVANPDGYAFTWTQNRMWRKTRTGPRQGCYGVDPNRNWNFKWEVSGYSTNPCSETYAGPSPFSEVEPKQIADFVSKLPHAVVYFDIHTYSEDFMYSYGYAEVYPPDVLDLDRVAGKAVEAINNKNGETFRYGSITDIIYPASGSSVDYVKGKLGVKYSYAMELRPNEYASDGFIVDNDQIIPGADECWAGLQVVFNAAANE